MTASPDLAERYGAPSPVRRRLLAGTAAAVVAVFLAWLAWAAWFQATPAVQSSLVAWDVVDENQATATVSVRLDGGVAASCVVRAVAKDHNTVGEVAFTPVDGTNRVTVRTERTATSITLVGCTTEGQNRPR